MNNDLFTRARERIDEAKELARDQHERMREDLRFSNPAKPEQWSSQALDSRTGRPALTLDRTNQFISQVVNDARQNNPGIQVMGVDDKADPKAAETLSGIFRHIEYQSRASQAYDTAIELSARVGLGWIRLVTEVVNEATNEQEIRILRVVDPTSCGLDPNSQDPDGRDAMWGYAETRVHQKTFQKQYPKAKPVSFGDAGWNSGEFITVAEYFEVVEQEGNHIVFTNPDGYKESLPEDDFWGYSNKLGVSLEVIETVKAPTRKVRWVKMTGSEVLEETEFPSKYIPIVPVLGYELWLDGKRHLCGLTRRLMDGQRLHNYQMSAIAEYLASQPKAPFIVPAEGVAGWEAEWKKLNGGNPAFLPYNALDEKGGAIPPPSRLAPPTMPGAFASMAQFATQEMEAAVGMYKANLGQQGNETSGRAIRARQMEGDTATFHFIDNLSRAIEHVGRIALDVLARICDTEQIKQILGVDGKRDMVRVDPQMPQAAAADPKGKVVAINPAIGRYDVRIQAGPSYTTQREETAQQLADMIQAQPNLAPILGPMWARMKDFPDSDKVAKLLLAMAPPQVQAIEEDEEMPPAAVAKIKAMEQQMQQMGQAMDQAAQRIQELEAEDKKTTLEYLAKAAEIEAKEYDAQTKRLQVLGATITPEAVQQIAMQTVMQAMQREPLQGGEELENTVQSMEGMPDADPYGEAVIPPAPPEPQGLPQEPQPEQPASAGFFMPEQEAE